MIIVVSLIVVALAFLFLFGFGKNLETDELPENCEIQITLADYTAKDDVITFNCEVDLENHSSEDKYYKISGDFKTEYNAKMIDERVLPCYDTETDFEVFFVPAQTVGLFKVSFTSTGDDSVKKPDRLAPDVVVEEVSENLVEKDEFVKNEVYLGINGNSDVFYNIEDK